MSGNQDAILFKVADFIRRKVKRTKNRIFNLEQFTIWIKDMIVAGVHHTIHGLKDFGRDSKWLI